MAVSDEELRARDRENRLHMGAIRQGWWLGLPMKLTLLLFGVAYEIQVNVTGIRGLMWAAAFLVPTYVYARWAVRRSIFGIDVLFGFCRTGMLALDWWTWGGSRRAALPARPGVRVRGIRYLWNGAPRHV